MASCCSDACNSNDQSGSPEETRLWFRVGLAALVSAQSMMFGLAVNISPPEGTERLVLHSLLAGLALVVFLLVGLPLVRESVAALVRGRVVVEQLFLAGVVGAYGISLHASLTGYGSVYYEVVTILVAIYMLGKLLGERRKQAALRSIGALQNEFSQCERIEDDGTTRTIPVEEVTAGDRILVAMGEAFAVDGVVRRGEGFVRETPVSGEPFPVVKRPGDKVVSGSYSVDAGFEVEAAGGRREIDPVLQGLSELRARPARLQRQADYLMTWFLPLVLVLAVGTFGFWSWYAGWVVAVFNALAVLVVACPCAMGLATPIGLWGGINALVRAGLRPRHADILEGLAQVDTVIFDKTGTLSTGRPMVVDFISDSTILPRQRLEELVAAAEAESRHPLAAAFSGWQQGVIRPETTRVLPGVGLEATFPDGTLRIGNGSLLERPDQVAAADSLRSRGHGAEHGQEIHVLWNEQAVGLAMICEEPRAEAADALGALRKAGVEVRIMTGDGSEAGRRLALELLGGESAEGQELEAGLTPSDKAARVEALQAEGRKVCFVGDGINDALALATADVSIAVGSGSALAREAADAEAVGDELKMVPGALLLSRRVVWSIRRNLALASLYNFAGIGMAVTGLLNPVVAALLMMGSSMMVTWLALRAAASFEVGEEKMETERHLLSAVRPPTFRMPGLQELRTTWAVPSLIFLAVAIQGPLVAHMGALTWQYAILATILAVVIGVALASAFQTAPTGGGVRMSVSMLSLGNLAMLIGWFGDAGWAPVIRDGACLCGCPDSAMGYGLISTFNWMQGFMVAASVPAVFLAGCVNLNSGRWRSIMHWVAGLVGMLLGMDLAAAAMAPVPVTDGTSHFLITFGAMAVGMCIGMVLACRVWIYFLQKEGASRMQLERTVS